MQNDASGTDRVADAIISRAAARHGWTMQRKAMLARLLKVWPVGIGLLGSASNKDQPLRISL